MKTSNLTDDNFDFKVDVDTTDGDQVDNNDDSGGKTCVDSMQQEDE